MQGCHAVNLAPTCVWSTFHLHEAGAQRPIGVQSRARAHQGAARLAPRRDARRLPDCRRWPPPPRRAGPRRARVPEGTNVPCPSYHPRVTGGYAVRNRSIPVQSQGLRFLSSLRGSAVPTITPPRGLPCAAPATLSSSKAQSSMHTGTLFTLFVQRHPPHPQLSQQISTLHETSDSLTSTQTNRRFVTLW
jgi:hypothetical protein